MEQDMICIRDASAADAPQILSIFSYYIENTAVAFDYEPPAAGTFVSRMEETLRRYPYLVACRGENVIGYAYAGPFVGREGYHPSCELTVYLAPDERGAGIGKQLYEALQERLAGMGIRNLYACISDPVVPDEYLTRASEHFHEKMGFQRVGLFHECAVKFGRRYNMIWMEKILNEGSNPRDADCREA